MRRTKSEIRAALANEQQRLAEIEHARQDSQVRLDALREELAALSGPATAADPSSSGPVPKTSKEKVELFRSLFRGRSDVYPARFVSRKTGKPGYANGVLDVAMVQSLVRKGEVDDRIAGYGHVIVDECHHLPAVSFERVLAEAKGRYRLGLTATPQRRDGHHPITTMQLGPVRHKIDIKNQAAQSVFEHKLIVRHTPFHMPDDGAEVPIQEIYHALVHDAGRNECIVDDVVECLHEGRAPILLTEREVHLELLVRQLREHVAELVTLHGGMSANQRREAANQLANTQAPSGRVVAATGRYIGEGFDDPFLDTLFLAMPVSWKGTLIQYSGQLHRYSPHKTEVRIYDYVDCNVPVLNRMFAKRMTTYRAIGYHEAKRE